MKQLLFAFLTAITCVGQVPDSGVQISTETVTKTVSREPRLVVLVFDDVGSVSAEVNYETVTRIGTNVVSRVPFKSSSLSWQQITNLVPALSASLEQFKAAAKSSMTNTP